MVLLDSLSPPLSLSLPLSLPQAVLVSPPDLECGFSRDLFLQWSNNPHNSIIFTSKTAHDTLARTLVDNLKVIKAGISLSDSCSHSHTLPHLFSPFLPLPPPLSHSTFPFFLPFPPSLSSYTLPQFFSFHLSLPPFPQIITIDMDVRRRVPLEGIELEEYLMKEKAKAATEDEAK